MTCVVREKSPAMDGSVSSSLGYLKMFRNFTHTIISKSDTESAVFVVPRCSHTVAAKSTYHGPSAFMVTELDMATVQSQKRVLSKAMRTMLRSLSSSDIQQQSLLITERVLASPFFQRSQAISCYLSMPSGEMDTSALVSGILRAGKTLFVPKIDVTQDGKMDFLKVYSEDDLRDFQPGVWGINEPGYEYRGNHRKNALDDTSEQLDLILLPGVAFDRSLSRLGYGKGYYDRYISRYTATNMRQKPLLVALALREQILEAGQVPTALHDWKVDVIAGPDGFVRSEGGPA